MTKTDRKARFGISVLEDLKDYKYEERTYDGLNRMTKVRNTNGITEYKYRPDRLRLTKQTGEKEILYAWNGNQIIAEIEDSSREKTNVYSYGKERVRKGVYFDDVEYYIYSTHGNVVQLAGETQYKHYDDEFEWVDKNLKKTYEYDAFGNELNPDENDTNYFRYCGEYYDKETENIYLRARNYNPASGVFTTEDPARDGLNWYVYCGNNPIMFIDPSGLKVYATGYDGSIGLGVTLSGGAYYVWDDNGNSGIMFSGGFGGGIALDHGSSVINFPEMENIQDLNGAGTSVDAILISISDSSGYKGLSLSYPGLKLQVNFSVSLIISIEDIKDFIDIN